MSAVGAERLENSSALPDYLPARMINEFVYCPRLFYYEQVQGVFVESADTIEGSVQHRRVDKETAGAPRQMRNRRNRSSHDRSRFHRKSIK